jgi:hypothetical protein
MSVAIVTIGIMRQFVLVQLVLGLEQPSAALTLVLVVGSVTCLKETLSLEQCLKSELY